MGPYRRAVIGTAALIGAGLAWYVATDRLGLVSPFRFPGPRDAGDAFAQVWGRGYAGADLVTHALRSLRLIALGFLVAVATGVPLGLAMGWSRRVEALVNPVFLIVRPIPPLAWIPLAILWLGLGDGAKIMVIWFAAFVPSVINAYAGVRAIEPSVIEAARMLGTPGPRLVAEVIVPASAPMIFTGLRLSLQASWTTLVAAELVGAIAGVGRVLNAAQQDIYPAMVLVGMAAVAVLGAGTTWLLGLAEHRAMPWLKARA